MTPWPLSVEMDAAALVYVPYNHVCSPATPIRPIRPHTKDLLYGLCLLGVSGRKSQDVLGVEYLRVPFLQDGLQPRYSEHMVALATLP